MKVFLTGATGFVGSHALPALLEAGHRVRALVRPRSRGKIPLTARDYPGLDIVEGEFLDPAATELLEEGAEAFVHLIGILSEDRRRGATFETVHVEAVERWLRRAARVKLGRWIHVSALGARDGAQSRYHQTLYRGEHRVKSSGIPYVIFRPSLIYGPGDGFFTRLKDWVRPAAPTPTLGDGKSLIQPVSVADVVEGILKSLESEATLGAIYEVGGPDRFTYAELIDLVAEAKGMTERPVKPRIPLGLASAIVRLVERLPGVTINREQLIMISEDNVCDPRPFYERLGIDPSQLTAERLREILA
jgi:NADH dehydrogenase